MFENRLYINGNDAFLRYGVLLAQGGINDLIKYPTRKAYLYNDWFEQEGIDADLSEPLFEPKEVSLTFYASSDSNLEEFVTDLTRSVYHTFEDKLLKRAFKLRLIKQTAVSLVNGFYFTTIAFADDFTADEMTKNSSYPVSSALLPDTGYTIDGVNLKDFDMAVLQGTDESLRNIIEVKQNVLHSSKYSSNLVYDKEQGYLTPTAKDATLKCLMRAENLEDLWNNWQALFLLLTRQGYRTLGKDNLQSYMFVYKSCEIPLFYPTDKIWLEFNLTITVIGNIAP
jgi:hypothetical protein|nr:MAG TPA: hypothetical protein [Caudoviricetes sp.]